MTVQSTPRPRVAVLDVAPPAAAAPTGFSALVVSHHPAERTALTEQLHHLGASPLHQAGSAGEALLCAHTWGPCELAVVDLDLPDELGLTLVADLRVRGWQRVVVLVGPGDHGVSEAAFRLGAHGVLLTRTVPASGSPPRDLAAIDASEVPGPHRVLSAAGMVKELSGREVQVLQLVAQGQANKEVGALLSLSALTVKSHLSRISRKLGTGDRAQMVALALRAGAIS